MYCRRNFLKMSGMSLVSAQSLEAFANDTSSYEYKARCNSSLPRGQRLANTNDWVGYEPEYLSRIADSFDCKMTFLSMNWARSMDSMKSGHLDLLTAVSWRADREAFLDYLFPFDVEKVVIMVLKENANTKIETLKDLSQQGIIEIQEKVAYSPDFDQAMAEDSAFAAQFSFSPNRSSEKANEYFMGHIHRLKKRRVWGILMRVEKVDYIYHQLGGGDNPVFNRDDFAFIESPVFPVENTFLVASKKTPLVNREMIKKAHHQFRSNSQFKLHWEAYYGQRALPVI